MQKQKAWRSEKHKARIRKMPCVACRSICDHAHHIRGVGHMGGMGLKAPDSATMPLCTRCHDALHSGRYPLEIQWEWLARTLMQIVEEDYNAVHQSSRVQGA